MEEMVITKSETADKQPYVTYEEYLALDGDAQITEWVNGKIIRYMPPFYTHQDIITFLAAIIREFVSILHLGEIIVAPFEVKLWPDGPSREPDILFIGEANRENRTEKRFEGGPDLVVEVISADSARRDRVDKFQEFERAGVREYWIIDPRPNQQQADFYVLDETGVFIPGEIDENGVFRSTVLSGFWLNVNWFWEEPLPNSQLLLAQVLMEAEGVSTEIRAAYRVLFEALAQNPFPR